MASTKINSYRYSELYIAVIYNLSQLHIAKCLRKALRQISESQVDVVVSSFRHHIKRKGKYLNQR